jgi:hypothetical protein
MGTTLQPLFDMLLKLHFFLIQKSNKSKINKNNFNSIAFLFFSNSQRFQINEISPIIHKNAIQRFVRRFDCNEFGNYIRMF